MLHKTIVFSQCRCNGEPFNREVMRIDGIRREWPNLDSRTGNSFNLRQQWNKHGKCVAKLIGIMENCWEYFDETMHMARLINERLDRWLNIQLFPEGFPNRSTHFSQPLIIESVERIYPHTVIPVWHPVIQWNGQTEYWIESINFCFDLWLHPIDCAVVYGSIPGLPRGYLRFVRIFEYSTNIGQLKSQISANFVRALESFKLKPMCY